MTRMKGSGGVGGGGGGGGVGGCVFNTERVFIWLITVRLFL